MKKIILPLALAVIASFSALTASAQLFVGSDDFSGGSSKWGYNFRIAGSGTSNGNLAFSGSQLDFSKGAGAGSFFWGWDGDGAGTASATGASYSTSWVSDLKVSNTLGASGSEFASIGFEVTDSAGNYSAMMLSSTGTGNFFRAEGTGFSANNTVATDTTDVFLRLSWDSASHTLNSFYSLDGSSYNLVNSFNPTAAWTPGPSSGFYFEVFGNSNMAAAISAGAISADNFSISAVPEPSTYAAFAGLGALGLAFWRRRQSRGAASA